MNIQKIYGIKNWEAIAGEWKWGSEDKFLGESDSDDEYVCCEFGYNNPQSEESIQITEKKRARYKLPGYTSKIYIFA